LVARAIILNAAPERHMHMEYAMRFHIPYTALGLALVAGAPAAHAQTVITREIVDQPVATVIAQQPLAVAPAGTVVQPMQTVQPVQTVQTTETIRTIRPAPRSARRQFVTTRTITRQRLVPAPTVVARTVTTMPRPLYDEVMPAPIAEDADYSTPPLYDTLAPIAPAAVATPVASGSYATPLIYRYVYEPDRILVIDPATGIAVQAIPR
jgi:hypothetical protein